MDGESREQDQPRTCRPCPQGLVRAVRSAPLRGRFRRRQLCDPDIVKIDGNLLHAARHHATTRVLYRHIAELIKGVGAHVVAEWIEDKDDLEFARANGVDYGQGFYRPHAQGRV